MRNKLIVVIILVLLVTAVIVQASFFGWVKNFFGMTGYAVLGDGCDTDNECDNGLTCDWTQPLVGKKGTCVGFPDDAKQGCQTKIAQSTAKLELIKSRLTTLERGNA